MDQENQISININSADEESLTELQGVGARLARRIIEERPFATIDDLTRVRGISEKDVERLRPFLSIVDAPEGSQVLDEMEVVDETENTDELQATEVASDELSSGETPIGDKSQTLEDLDEGEELAEKDQSDEIEASAANAGDDFPTEDQPLTQDEIEQPVELIDDPEIEEQEPKTTLELDQEPPPAELEPAEETPIKQPVAQPSYITRGGACSLVLIGGFLTLLLAVAVTLGILSSINQGRLDYASPSQITALQSQVETLTNQSQILAEDIDGMRNRMDNLEALSSQVSEMETELSSQQEEIDELQVKIAANQAAYDELVLQLTDIEEQVETLTNQGDRFESFLDGMHTLMEELFPQTPEVEETP